MDGEFRSAGLNCNEFCYIGYIARAARSIAASENNGCLVLVTPGRRWYYKQGLSALLGSVEPGRSPNKQRKGPGRAGPRRNSRSRVPKAVTSEFRAERLARLVCGPLPTGPYRRLPLG